MVIVWIVWRAIKLRQMQQVNSQAAVPHNENINLNPYQAYQNNSQISQVAINPHQNLDICYGQPINPGIHQQNVYLIKPNPVQLGRFNPSDPVTQNNTIVQPRIPRSNSI